MVLHGAGGVQDGQRAVGFRLECIVGAPVVQIVTQTRHQQAQNLQIRHEALHLARLHHGEHRLGHVQSVAPVVVLNGTVVFPHAQDPPAENLRKGVEDKGNRREDWNQLGLEQLLYKTSEVTYRTVRVLPF